MCRWVQTHECCECYRGEGGGGHSSFREALHPPHTTVSMLRYETSFVFLLVVYARRNTVVEMGPRVEVATVEVRLPYEACKVYRNAP